MTGPMAASAARRSPRSAIITDGTVMPRRPRRTNTSLFQSQGASADATQERGPARRAGARRFPAARHYRLAGGCVKDALRRCAAGLRPVLDPAARSRGMAAEREREQELGLQLRPRGSEAG